MLADMGLLGGGIEEMSGGVGGTTVLESGSRCFE
jgi:hypothetical protein